MGLSAEELKVDSSQVLDKGEEQYLYIYMVIIGELGKSKYNQKERVVQSSMKAICSETKE